MLSIIESSLPRAQCYRVRLETVVSDDSSSYGVRAVLIQKLIDSGQRPSYVCSTTEILPSQNSVCYSGIPFQCSVAY